MKKFICVSPHQPATQFSAGIYEAVDNEKLVFHSSTGFPIMNVINGYTEKGDDIEIITVVSNYDNAKRNYDVLKKEINAFVQTRGIRVTFIPVEIPYCDKLDTQLNLFEKLIDCMAESDILFCDITYGTKVMSQILTMALNYGYRIHKDVTFGCIVYGSMNHTTNERKIYDITSLNYMDEIVRMLAENHVTNPAAMIKGLLK